MSVPPQVIRVKRKRVDESPVAFLQFDDAVKRPRSGTNWVYQRRDPKAEQQQQQQYTPVRDVKPVIHVSSPKKTKNNDGQSAGGAKASTGRPIARAKSPSRAAAPTAQDHDRVRRFHISRKMMAADGGLQPPSPMGVSKRRGPRSPAVFVERRDGSKRKVVRQTASTPSQVKDTLDPTASVVSDDGVTGIGDGETVTAKSLKNPGAAAKTRKPTQEDTPSQPSLPSSNMSYRDQDMEKMAAEMNQWVLNEIGANLEDIERQKQKEQRPRPRFKPKAPALRYKDRHPEGQNLSKAERGLGESRQGDEADGNDEESDYEGDEDSWVIDEYVRVPANSVALDAQPGMVGVLVLDGEEESNLFFGNEDDDEDYLPDDEEDENAENHYTADYPEDEVDSDDEYGRYPYGYRNDNASDDEEFDQDNYYSDSNPEEDDTGDDMVMERGEADDDDATMARLRAYMRRHYAVR